MNKIRKHISTAGSIFVLFALLMGIVYLFQPASNPPIAARATEIPVSGYPAPNTPVNPTQLATLMAYVTEEVITIEDLTPLWFTPEPTLTFTPSVTGSVIYDALNGFQLTLPAGWYAYVPDPNAVAGATTLTNFDLQTTAEKPAKGLLIDVSSGQLANGQTFEEWVSERRAKFVPADLSAATIQLSEVTPYQLGRFDGLAFRIQRSFNDVSLAILLPSDSARVWVILIRPFTPLEAELDLSFLDSIEIYSDITP